VLYKGIVKTIAEIFPMDKRVLESSYYFSFFWRYIQRKQVTCQWSYTGFVMELRTEPKLLMSNEVFPIQGV